jgi:putative redox protein
VSDEPTTTSNVEVRWVENDLFVGSDDQGHSVVFDSGLDGKKTPRGMGPMKALLASLGACSGMDVEAILLKRKQRLTSLVVHVSGKRRQFGHPKPFTEVHVKYILGGAALDERFVKEAVTDSITKFCSVAATMNEKAKISYSYEISLD